MSSDRYEAVVFDMDGVVTDTARLHELAWKRLFDRYLAAAAPGSRPFDENDYLHYVDGRARIDGVTGFLASRGLTLPLGEEDGPASLETAFGLARTKNDEFLAAVSSEGVTVFASTVELIGRLRAAGVRTAVVTASRNAEALLGQAGIAGLFDARVDGVVSAELGLAGKPDPASFLEAAHRLGVDPGTAVVVEDALAGVAAGRRGGFGLVVGIDRVGQADELAHAGADVVVKDLGELSDDVFYSADPWVLAYRGFDPATEGTREALLTVGNGYLATRGAMSHVEADGVHYPGSYVAGTYNRLTSHLEGRSREDESIVNLPNWTSLTFRAAGAEWLDARSAVLAGHRVALELKDATLTRQATVIDTDGRRTRFVERRLVSMATPHLAAIELRLRPENWSGRLDVRSVIDGRVSNRNVSVHRHLNGEHLGVVDRRHEDGLSCLITETATSHVRVALSTRTTVERSNDGRAATSRIVETETAVGEEWSVDLAKDEEVVVEKVVAVVTSRDRAIFEPLATSHRLVASAPRYAAIAAAHRHEWAELWRRFRIDTADGDDVQLALRVDLVHLLQTLSPHSAELDVGVPARGLHGEGYLGHVFWDELFVFPLFDLRLPALTRALLGYRWRRLPEAQLRAAELGCRGALFPWQSGSDGSEETPAELYNPRSERWVADHSARQCHVNVAIAYNAWRHFQVTADLGFLSGEGIDLVVETARFFASRATYDARSDRYDLRGVMGPDEFHDGYPDRPGEGIDNNAYLNVMAAWSLERASASLELLGEELGRGVRSRLGIDDAELERWDAVSRRLRVPWLSNGLLAQFEGYEALVELDWERYRRHYDNFGRMDLILEAEGDTTNRYRLSKQADALMLFYLLSAEELTATLGRLGYDFDPSTIPATVEYYLARTSHGSTLSRVAHAWVLARTDRARSWQLLVEALGADLADAQGGTTREGVHLGAMGGTVDLIERCYTGLEARNDALFFNPLLPDELTSLEFLLRYRDQVITVRVDHGVLRLTSAPGPAAAVTVDYRGERRRLSSGRELRFSLSGPDKVS